MSRRVPALSLLLAIGCVPTENRSVEAPPGDLTGCVGEGSRRRGVFDKPFEFMTRDVRADLSPRWVQYSRDRAGDDLIDRQVFDYDADGRMVGSLLDDDGDHAFEYAESWQWSDEGLLLAWERTDARGHLREAEYRFHARWDRLFRVLRDLDGDGRIDEVEESDWDAEGRLLGVDTWDPNTGQPLRRLIVEYLDDWPRMDRLEREDIDGDNVMDLGTWYTYDDDGLLASTVDQTGATTTYAWDPEGRLASSYTLGPGGATTFEATWTDLGLPVWTRTDLDADEDGEIDETTITEWSWTCDGPDADG